MVVLYGTAVVHISTPPVYASINMKVGNNATVMVHILLAFGQCHGDGSRTFGLWARRIAKKESIVFGNFNLVLVESFSVEPSISCIAEMLEDFCLVVWLDRIPLHNVRARARRARPSAFLVLRAKESTRGRLKAVRE